MLLCTAMLSTMSLSVFAVNISASPDALERMEHSCVISFPKTGSYEFWLRVCDSHNVWSDWVIFTANVESAVISDVSVGGISGR